ncbi:MAG: cache domain-containing protein [Pseudomonadota bacterium]
MWKRLKKIKNISLKWKLLIPFLSLPVALTVLMVALEIGSQQQLLLQEEEKSMRQQFVNFHRRLRLRLDLAQAAATLIAENPMVQKALAEQDRETLQRLYQPVFNTLKTTVGLNLVHFHLYPARSFLRMHRPGNHGEDLTSYRQTIMQAYKTGRAVAGLEFGLMGFSLRGVAPVYYQGKLVGSVEAGSLLEMSVLETLKRDFGCDLSIYLPAPNYPQGFSLLATTSSRHTLLAPQAYRQVIDKGEIIFLTLTHDQRRLAILAGPIQDFQGRRVEVLEMTRDREPTLAVIQQQALFIAAFGLGILLLSLIFVWWISALFLAPIWVLVDQSQKIAAGERVPMMEVTVRDEFGTLAEALNEMLAGLEDSRRRLQNQAQELEQKVRERTEELVRSEEKFRTLLEEIPLVVYRLEPGLIRTFVSSHIERLTGRPPEEAVGGVEVWSKMIHPKDRNRVVAAKKRSLEKCAALQMEYLLQDRQGQEIEILDRAEPVYNNSGQCLHMEGYMLDIRDRKRLEEQTVKAEELKTLSEISSRLAHEFRNPLATVGLCAQRLTKKLSETDPASPYTKILIDEVARLEQILRMILTYIQPMGLDLQELDPAKFLAELAQQAAPFKESKNIELVLDLDQDLPILKIDAGLMTRAILNLMRNAVFQMPSRGVLKLSAALNADSLEIKLIYPAGYLPDDQLRHFFYPFTTEEADASLVDLPLVPVIVHKHSGGINVGRQGEDLIVVTVSLPVR